MRWRAASVKEADPQQAGGGAAINFFGSNADATRHFAEDEEESSDDGDTGTEGELLSGCWVQGGGRQLLAAPTGSVACRTG